jgi:N-acetyl-anhydromuramyl-L-alanine amidase AmpD
MTSEIFPALGYDIIDYPSENFGSNERGTGRGLIKPVCVIIHCIGNALPEALSILTQSVQNGGHGVSAHYFIPELTGRELLQQSWDIFEKFTFQHPEQVPVFRLVKEEDRAFHAGLSQWNPFNLLAGCENNLNSCSIGIEFHAPGYALSDGSDLYRFVPYRREQIAVGLKLIQDILKRWKIPPENLLGHSDVSPGRKTDPGPLFPWAEFAQAGLGAKIDPTQEQLLIPHFHSETEKIAFVQSHLNRIGYFCSESKIMDHATQNCINSFRMHFLHKDWRGFHGEIDQELIQNLMKTPAIFI